MGRGEWVKHYQILIKSYNQRQAFQSNAILEKFYRKVILYTLLHYIITFILFYKNNVYVYKKLIIVKILFPSI